MILLKNRQIKQIEDQHLGTRIQNDKMIYKYQAVIVNIPSKLYPLTNKKTIQVFHASIANL